MPNPKKIGFGEPLTFMGAPNTPINGLPLAIASAIQRAASGVAVGGDQLYLGPQTAGTGAGWTLTETAAGAGNAQSVKQNNLGQLVLTTDNGDDDLENLQFLNRAFRYSATRNIACFARLKVADADDGEAAFGLCIADASLIAGMTDGIHFRKTETGTDFTFVVEKNSAETTAACGLTLADDTFVVLGFTVIGGAIRWYAFADSNDLVGNNDNPRKWGTGTAVSTLTNAPDDEDVFLSFAVQTGAADVNSMTVDWAIAVQWDAAS